MRFKKAYLQKNVKKKLIPTSRNGKLGLELSIQN